MHLFQVCEPAGDVFWREKERVINRRWGVGAEDR